MNNTVAGVNVPLSTFGGMSTELSPTDLPEGGSPDNQDIAFLPGSWLTRPGLHRLYANEPEATAVMSQDTFTSLKKKVFNVKLYASGNLWAENHTDSPGVWTKVGTVAPNSRFKSVSAFGRLFMAFNDGLRGTDLPRSFDGTNWNRVSQGGPCLNPTFGETILPAVTLASMGGGASVAVTSLAASGAHTSTVRVPVPDPPVGGPYWTEETITVYSTITVTVASSAGFSAGQTATVSGNAGWNGSAVIQSTSPTTIVLYYNQQDNVSGAGGTIAIGAGITLSRSANVVLAGTTSAHGLQPGDMFTISGVSNTVLGGTISAAARSNNIITITTTAANGVRVGSTVVIAGVTDTTFNGNWVVTQVISSTVFQVESSNLSDATSSGGTVSGIWNNTKRFVISVPTSTQLTYDDVGPDATTTNSGTITPVGQIAGGNRNAVCLFLTNYGFRTPPSTPVTIATTGGKKMVINNIPVGPSNVVARIIAFTGVDGSSYFYIPVPVRSNGNVIGTSTVINDNTSTSAIFDFSDDALLSSLAIDDYAVGTTNTTNLFRLKILGNSAGVFSYADRMFYWGDENKAINFLNMGFEGGINADGTPASWTVSGTGLSVVTTGDFGDAIQFAAGSTAKVYQSCYLDYYGDQILEPSTQYTFKCWAKQSGTGASVVAEIYDTGGASVLATVTIAVPATASFISGAFSVQTPVTIPAGSVLRVYVTGNGASVVTLDELSCIYTSNPYNDTTYDVSYTLDPESVDNLTGHLGATADPTMIMEAGRMRDNMYFTTRNTLQTTKDVAGSEPSAWSVNEIAQVCGSCSMFTMVSGESWLGWVSDDGARIFDGSLPIKITQDFQSEWDAINQSALTAVWSTNDVANRRIYYGVPIGSTLANKVYTLDYRYAETASQIEDRGAIRISGFTGKMLVIEMSRKFSPWTIQASAGGFLTTAEGAIPVFADAGGRSYWLDPAKHSDDDYGTIPWYYTSSPFVSGELEQALQLGNHRHLYTFLTFFCAGIGKISVTPLADSLTNTWPVRGPYPLSLSPTRSLEIPLNVSGERVFFKFSGTPLAGQTDSAITNVSRMVVTMQPHPYAQIYG